MKLNKEQKNKVLALQEELIIFNQIIDQKYRFLVNDLGDDLSEENEGWLWDLCMNPTCNPDLAEEHLFEKDPVHSPKIGDRYQYLSQGTEYYGDIFIVCTHAFENTEELYFTLQNLENGEHWSYLTEDISEVFGQSSHEFAYLCNE